MSPSPIDDRRTNITGSGEAEHGDEPPSLPRLLGSTHSFRPEPELEVLSLSCGLVATFGLTVANEELVSTVSQALERSRARYGAGWGDAQQMGLAREFLKVLCGKTLLKDTAAAAKQSASEARAGSDDSLEWYEQVQKMLSPATSGGDPGAYFDPRSWEVDQIRATTEPERFVRLALFVEAMLDQEEGLRDAEATLLQAAVRAIQERP